MMKKIKINNGSTGETVKEETKRTMSNVGKAACPLTSIASSML